MCRRTVVGIVMDMIQARDLTKRYGPTLAVDGLTFDVKPGYVTGFLGPNGAGKSTTMRMVLGLDAPTSGTALVAGRPYTSLRRPLHEVGALLSADAVHPGRSARNHLRCLARSNHIGNARVDSVLEQVGIADVAHRRVGTFSLGMKQRLGIAQALLGDPEVLLFDEPINGLDPVGIRWVRELMRTLAEEGRTVLVSSHLMSEMASTADRVLVIGRGRLIADASMTELTDQFARDVRVRSPQAEELAQVLARVGGTVTSRLGDLLDVVGLDTPTIAAEAATYAIPVHELTPRSATLEEAYLAMTGDLVEYDTRVAEVAR